MHDAAKLISLLSSPLDRDWERDQLSPHRWRAKTFWSAGGNFLVATNVYLTGRRSNTNYDTSMHMFEWTQNSSDNLPDVKRKFYDVGHLTNTLVIVVATAVLHNFALIHREQDFIDDIEVEHVLFDIVAASDASGNAKRQLIILLSTSGLESLYPIRPIIVFLVRWNLLCDSL